MGGVGLGFKNLEGNLASRCGKFVLQMYQGSEGYRVGSNGGKRKMVGQELQKVLQKGFWFGIATGSKFSFQVSVPGAVDSAQKLRKKEKRKRKLHLLFYN